MISTHFAITSIPQGPVEHNTVILQPEFDERAAACAELDAWDKSIGVGIKKLVDAIHDNKAIPQLGECEPTNLARGVVYAIKTLNGSDFATFTRSLPKNFIQQNRELIEREVKNYYVLQERAKVISTTDADRRINLRLAQINAL